MSDTSDAVRAETRARIRANWTDRLLSAAAGVVAASALAVSVYQAYITRQQQKLSAWPYLVQYMNNGDGGYERVVHNVGIGPALVRSMTITVDGRPMHTWRDVGRVLYGDSLEAIARRDSAQSITSTFGRGSVLLPATPIRMLRLTGRTVPARVQELLSSDRVEMRVCYCSLYDDCWVASTRQEEPSPARACAVDRAREFRD